MAFIAREIHTLEIEKMVSQNEIDTVHIEQAILIFFAQKETDPFISVSPIGGLLQAQRFFSNSRNARLY